MVRHAIFDHGAIRTAQRSRIFVIAIFAAHSAKQLVSPAMIAREMETTRPLAVVMAEKVAALCAWAAGRTVSAD